MRDAQVLCVGLSLLVAGIMTVSSPFASAQAVAYTYDENGRLTAVDYGGGHTLTYAYDAATNTVCETSSSPDNTLFVAISPVGAGSVTGDGIVCPGDCSEAFPGSPTVILTANPGGGFQLLSWSGDVSGVANPATLTMSDDRSAGCFFGATNGHTDSDGLGDLMEMGPDGNDPTYDGNHDGISDYQQSNVASLPTFDGQAYASLAVPEPLVLTAVSAEDIPSRSDPPPGTAFPFGLFSFTIEGLELGGCTELDLFLPPAQLTSYFKHGPTADDEIPHWYEFVHYHPALPGAEVWSEDGFSQARLFLCDAQLGDDMIVEDRLIIDIGGPSGILVAEIVVDPQSLNFGEISAGTSSELSVTVSATGQDDLTIGSIAAADPLYSPFTITADTCSGATLAGGATCFIAVRFAPLDAGDFSDTFDIPSNAAASPSVTVSVMGSVTQTIAIPILSKPGLIILVILLACIGFDIIRRRLV